MSGGTGSRFGADCPKQYCTMEGRLVIDYVIDACRKTKQADEIVIVTAAEYEDFISRRYGLPVVRGGASRPESVASGLRFVNEQYACEKLIITNAVCPLATSGQYDAYFTFLEEYDFVLTTWKLAPALHRFDGTRVDRDDFFNVMEPDAYRFKALYNSFDFHDLQKYIFHNMPADSKAMFCFDYPYTMKLTYPHDLKLLEALYDEIVTKPERERTLQTVSHYLSSDGTQGIGKWVSAVQKNMAELVHKYEIMSYSLNSQTEANIVYEAQSNLHGSIIIKFTPSKFHFNKELTYYKASSPDIMAELLDYDESYAALTLRMVKPGIQIKFDVNNEELRLFYDKVDQGMIQEKLIEHGGQLPTIMGEFEEYVRAAGRFTFEYRFRKEMEKKAREIWNRYFEHAEKYLLHRDLHRRNILKSADKGILAIDPRGAVGPRAFEYVIPFIIELREYDHFHKEMYDQLFGYFTKYVKEDELRAALFIFWVYKMNDYTFQKNDNYKLAGWCRECIMSIYYDGLTADEAFAAEPSGL